MVVCQREHEQPQRGRVKGRPGWLDLLVKPHFMFLVQWCTVRWRGLKIAFSHCQHRATEPSTHMLTRSAKTNDSKAQECGADLTSQPAHNCQVRHGPGSCQALSDSLEWDQGSRVKASGSAEHEWCEWQLFQVSDPLPVDTAFSLLLSSIVRVAVGLWVGMYGYFSLSTNRKRANCAKNNMATKIWRIICI